TSRPTRPHLCAHVVIHQSIAIGPSLAATVPAPKPLIPKAYQPGSTTMHAGTTLGRAPGLSSVDRQTQYRAHGSTPGWLGKSPRTNWPSVHCVLQKNYNSHS